MAGLNAGIANTWIDQYSTQPVPCLTNTTSISGSISSCLVWLVVGLVVGSITFGKKGSQQ